MHDLRDLVYRLRQGESERAIARDLGLSRMTVRKYHARAEGAGYLKAEATLPPPKTVMTALVIASEAPRTASGVEPYATVVAELIATHLRATRKGSWQTRMEHYPAQKAAFLERTPQFCRSLAERIGPATSEVVGQLLADRPLDRLRSVQGILGLAETVGRTRLEAACRRALAFGDPRYRRIKEILNAGLDQAPLPELPEPAPGAGPGGDRSESSATSTATLPAPAPTYTFERTAAELFPEDVRAPASAEVSR